MNSHPPRANGLAVSMPRRSGSSTTMPSSVFGRERGAG
jgi:hypothetical protein